LRILGAAEPEPEDVKKAGNDNDMSRSSSSSGKKKSKKRKDDDDFEPRSQFPGYYTPSHNNNNNNNNTNNNNHNGYSDASFYFPQFGGMMTTPQQYPMAPTASPPPIVYPNGYQPVDPSGQMQYMAPQQYGNQPSSGVNGQVYAQSQGGPFDISTQFQAMSFSTPSPGGLPQKPGGSPSFAAVSQMQPHQQGWAAQYDTSQGYMYGQQMFSSQYPDRSMSSPAQTPTTIPYPYGQLPNPALQNGKFQHPLPGSFNRQQFNPQTQAFVPGGGRSGGVPMPSQNGAPLFSPYAMSQNGMQTYRPTSGASQGSQHRSPPMKSHAGAYPPPAAPQHIQAYNLNTPTMHFSSMVQSNQGHSYPSGTSANSSGNQRPSLGQNVSNDNQPLAHPLPQLPNPESSIAKWGTPSHLPPKPPTPTNPHPTKFIDINKNLPTRNAIQGLPRSYMQNGGNN
jgi:hypothetical protein